jgi:hypothetical protein
MLQLPRHKLRLALILLGLFSSFWAFAQQPYYGHFVGRLILSPEPGGSSMRLLEGFTFIDSSGGTWDAPAGTITDGASIPQAAKSLVGGSWDGPYRYAAVIHDVACVRQNRPWELVHLTFYHAMLAANVSPRLAKIMYAAVYHLGPRWGPGSSIPVPQARQSPDRAHDRPSSASASGRCEANAYEQCWSVDLGPVGVIKDCKCLPKVGGDIAEPKAIQVPHPKAEEVIEKNKSESEAVAKLARYIDAKENAGGISIEEIQRLQYQRLP